MHDGQDLLDFLSLYVGDVDHRAEVFERVRVQLLAFEQVVIASYDLYVRLVVASVLQVAQIVGLVAGVLPALILRSQAIVWHALCRRRITALHADLQTLEAVALILAQEAGQSVTIRSMLLHLI